VSEEARSDRFLRQGRVTTGPYPDGGICGRQGSSHARSFDDASRNTYDLMAQNPEYGLCGCRINPRPCLPTSSEIHTVGEREIRIFNGFRCRLNTLTPRGLRLSLETSHHLGGRSRRTSNRNTVYLGESERRSHLFLYIPCADTSELWTLRFRPLVRTLSEDVVIHLGFEAKCVIPVVKLRALVA